jgi:hypothetical protein
MSNLSDALDAIGVKQGTAVKFIGGAIGLAADLSGVGGVILGAVDLLTGKADAESNLLQDIFDTIKTEFKKIDQEAKATAIQEKLAHIGLAMKDAEGVKDNLPANLAANPPLSDAERIEEIGKCLSAADFFEDPANGNFLTVFSQEVYYEDPWNGRLGHSGDTPPDDLIFTTRYYLPAYLKALYILILAIGKLKPEFNTFYKDPLTKHRKKLEDVYLKAKEISGSRVPEDGEILTIRDLPLPFQPFYVVDGNGKVAETAWTLSGFPPEFFQVFGGIDIFTGANSVGNFPPLDPPTTGPPPPVAYFDFFRTRLRLATLKRVKDVYKALGLPEVVSAIQNLAQLAGDPPPFAVDESYWSLREFDRVLGTTLAGQVSLPPGISVSAKDVFRRMAILGGGSPQQSPLRFRDVLGSVTP